MSPSKTEQVLEAMRSRLLTIPDAVVERNSVLPEKVPDSGLIILRDGDPGEPEQSLGGFGSVYYQHAVEIEIYVEEGDATVRDAAALLSDGSFHSVVVLDFDGALAGIVTTTDLARYLRDSL